jgi:hypothetical protein
VIATIGQAFVGYVSEDVAHISNQSLSRVMPWQLKVEMVIPFLICVEPTKSTVMS